MSFLSLPQYKTSLFPSPFSRGSLRRRPLSIYLCTKEPRLKALMPGLPRSWHSRDEGHPGTTMPRCRGSSSTVHLSSPSLQCHEKLIKSQLHQSIYKKQKAFVFTYMDKTDDCKWCANQVCFLCRHSVFSDWVSTVCQKNTQKTDNIVYTPACFNIIFLPIRTSDHKNQWYFTTQPYTIPKLTLFNIVNV